MRDLFSDRLDIDIAIANAKAILECESKEQRFAMTIFMHLRRLTHFPTLSPKEKRLLKELEGIKYEHPSEPRNVLNYIKLLTQAKYSPINLDDYVDDEIFRVLITLVYKPFYEGNE